MVDPVYKWKRFWSPRSGEINFGDGGYLIDPDSEWGHHYNPDLVDFDKISHLRCLILLGEPGIGKTHAIETEESKLIDKGHKKGYDILKLRLRSCTNIDKLFKHKTFSDWISGTYNLHIFLDSLDEGLLNIDILATLLVDGFEEFFDDYPDYINRLYLRITCRTAIFPKFLEGALAKIFGKESLGIYELAPLRRIDVIETLQTNGLDSNIFLEEVQRKGVSAFAIKPITLKFLINTYRRNNYRFPPEQKLSDLYLDGCRELCEEPPENDFRASKELINLDSDQRLIVAAKIAAVTIFANRSAIWIESGQGKISDEDVPLRILCQGDAIAKEREFPVTESAVRETLDTGLFSGRGENKCLGWVHQTYAEFMAAWCLKEHKLSLSEIMNLIIHPEDPDKRIVPQLYETVAWLASMIPEVFQEVMKTDPDILLQSDIGTTSEVDKAALVESLLKLYDEDKLVYHYRLSSSYEKLNHSELSKQLKPYICEYNKSIHSRYVAIEIAEECDVKSLQENLVDVALDSENDYWVKTRAVQAVGSIGDKNSKTRLKPLAFGENENDPEDELKAQVLKALYPNYITVEEVLNVLTQPKIQHTIGGRYQEFIAKEIGQHLTLTDLPLALNWLEKLLTRQQTRRCELSYPFTQLSDEIMIKAWEHLEDKNILEGFARISLIRLQKYEEIVDHYYHPAFKDNLIRNDNKRRSLIEAIISIIPENVQELYWLVNSISFDRTPIILNQDFQWILECCAVSQPEHKQKIYAKLIKLRFDINNAQQVNAFLTADEKNPLFFKAEFPSLLEPIVLGSDRAKKAESEYLEDMKILSHEEKPLLQPPPKKRIIIILNQIELVQINLWCRLCQAMILKPTSKHFNESYNPDLTNLPGWEEAEDITKIRIISAAKLYILQGEPENNSWVGTNSFYDSALYGYKALCLVSAKDNNFISTISPDIWKKWTPIIIDYPNADQYKDYRQYLISKAYKNAPDEFIRIVMILIDKENEQYSQIRHIVDQIRCCWDEHLGNIILEKLKDDKLTHESIESLLKYLLINQVNEAQIFAESLISLPPPKLAKERAKAITAAKMLMLYTKDASWSIIWSAIQQDREFGREVMESVSYSTSYKGTVEQKLKDECIADLYIFLVKEYPDVEEKQQNDSQDEEITGSKAWNITPKDSVKTWKDYIPERLQRRGTREACAALNKIIRELPELKDKLQWRLLDAEALVRRQTWKPYSPEEIIQLLSSKINYRDKSILSKGMTININGQVGVINSNSTVNGDQIVEQNNYSPDKNLIEAFDEIQQIINRITENYSTTTEAEKQIVVDKTVSEVKQNSMLMKRLNAAGKAFTFEAIKKASDLWWISPVVEAIKAAINPK